MRPILLIEENHFLVFFRDPREGVGCESETLTKTAANLCGRVFSICNYTGFEIASIIPVLQLASSTLKQNPCCHFLLVF